VFALPSGTRLTPPDQSRGAERRFVAIMKAHAAAEGARRQYGPTSPGNAFAFIVPVEREFDN
jgi:hypothetical protein